MKTTEDVRKYATEQAISEEESSKNGMVEKSTEFLEDGAEVHAKTRNQYLASRSDEKEYGRLDKLALAKSRANYISGIKPNLSAHTFFG